MIFAYLQVVTKVYFTSLEPLPIEASIKWDSLQSAKDSAVEKASREKAPQKLTEEHCKLVSWKDIKHNYSHVSSLQWIIITVGHPNFWHYEGFLNSFHFESGRNG